jgi:hypothetical protein
MRLTRKAAFAGLASLAVAGAAVAADAPRFHTMNVSLPDGAVAHVRYSGDVAPTITFDRAPAQSWVDPAAILAGFDPAPFAALDRMAAEMDREAAVMLRHARSGAPGANLAAGGPGMTLLGGAGLPPGVAGYSFVSETTSNGSCTRSIEMTRAGPNAKPQTVTHQSGNCGAPAASTAPRAGASAAAKPVKPASPAATNSSTI